MSARPYLSAAAPASCYDAHVSSRASTLALVDAQAPCPQSCGARAESLASSCDELLVCDARARSRFDETIKTRKRAALHVAIVEPECELVNVTGKMLGAGVMVDASKPALQH